MICPEHWVKCMIKLIPAYDKEPFFTVHEGAERFPLTSRQLSRLLGEWTEKVGLDPTDYTAHCLRRRGLNWGHQAKLTGEALKVLGDWGSTAYLRYLDLDFEFRLQSAKEMAECAKKRKL